jgi:peptidyl-prolyl cis-trans isomerase A (cyclophilin A)
MSKPPAGLNMEENMSYQKSDYKEDLDRLVAVFQTTLGDFEVELYAKECPETVWNFINLVEGRQETDRKGNYYDGLTFHRVINGFMIQGGCPLGTGTGGPGYNFQDEFDASLRHTSEGILSMANAGPAPMEVNFLSHWDLHPTWMIDIRYLVRSFKEQR